MEIREEIHYVGWAEGAKFLMSWERNLMGVLDRTKPVSLEED
jgi:hypothetical protein